MATTGTADAVAAEWHEPVRELFQPAWEALDRAQIALYRQYQDTRDDRVAVFKRRFDKAAGALISLAVEELYAPYASDVKTTGNEPGEDREGGEQDQ